jgi:hypothetical protein
MGAWCPMQAPAGNLNLSAAAYREKSLIADKGMLG